MPTQRQPRAVPFRSGGSAPSAFVKRLEVEVKGSLTLKFYGVFCGLDGVFVQVKFENSIFMNFHFGRAKWLILILESEMANFDFGRLNG